MTQIATPQNTQAKPDNLLRGTRLLLLLITIIAAVVFVAIALGIPAMWLGRDFITVEAAKEGTRLLGNQPFFAITVILLGCLVMVGLAIFFLRKLIAIIDSVGTGTPFSDENARRLTVMGWTILAAEGLALLALPLGPWLQNSLPGGETDIDFSVSMDSIITALLLFILSRVFREGARMRDDLEGTV